MSKKISAFRSLCEADQVAALKGGCTEMMILRSAMQYDSTKAKWQVITTKPPAIQINLTHNFRFSLPT